jgi:hypothetical protein
MITDHEEERSPIKEHNERRRSRRHGGSVG